MQQPLYLKHRLIGTPAERPLGTARWLLRAPTRWRHPELTAMHREPRYIDDVLAHLLQPGWSCIDGGAHIGSMTATFLRLCPDGHHLAVEPVPTKAAWLRERYPAADVRQVALGATPDRQVFFEDRRRSGFSGLRPAGGGRNVSYEVEIARLDDLTGDRHVDFLKLDVEGAELDALRGATGLLRRDRPIILFECGVQTALDAFGYLRTDLWDLLTAEGYDIRLVQDVVFGRDPMGREEFRRAGSYPFPGFNYLATPSGTPAHRLR